MRIVKLNITTNKAYDASGNEVTNFDNDTVTKVKFRLNDGSIITTENIERVPGNYYKVVYNGEEYYIDDNNRYESVVLGYLVYKDYDKNHIEDKETGVELRNELFSYINTNLGMSVRAKTITRNGIDFIVTVDTVNWIVSENQERKQAGRKIFPFNKSMDKYATFYLAIYSNIKDVSSDIECNKLLEEIKEKLGDEWKFVPNEYKIKIPLNL